MISTLLGLGDIIGKAIGKVLETILSPIIEGVFKLVFNWVIKPLIILAIEVITRAISGILYVISCFILQLIDFVELLFRSLAGLESASSTGMSMELSLDGGTGDILIQLIRHPDIQSAFVSMCIVGLFLLVVTTVFQIIKVEYTTEGAKNAKGPILQKAFRGLSNLMLLPLLVVFGIVFANQLLGLLDTATKGDGDNPTISGLIFVTSASGAHYREGEDVIIMESDSTVGIIIESLEAAIKTFLKFSDVTNPDNGDYVNNDAKRAAIEDSFISQSSGYRYYKISNVSQYYDFTNINYLLLLFGGVFVLKSLFFASFGMVIRLYKCAMLFIISPAIIGMTPINEGGLGSWRKSFIGQVLAGYGTILSLNLFFIIVRVLLSIEVKFNQKVLGTDVGFLTGGFMTFLLKAIFVLAGCLLIEQFSKEIGGYFGADDAMGSGKQMAGQVGDMAMKGIQAAALVGTGGAALAMKGAKMAGGIASKVAKSGPGQALGKLGGKIGDGAKWVGGKVKAFDNKVQDTTVGGGLAKGVRAVGKGIGAGAKGIGKGIGAGAKGIGDGFAWIGGGRDAVDARNVSKLGKKKGNLEALRSQGQSYLDANRSRYENEKNKAASLQDTEFIKSYEAAQSNVNNLDTGITSMNDRIKNANKRNETKQTAKEDAKTLARNKVFNAVGTIYGLGQQGKGNLPGSKYFKQFSDAASSGTKALGGAYETAHGDLEYRRGKHLQDSAAELPIIGNMIAANTSIAASRISIQAAKETQATMNQIKVTAEDLMERFLDYAKSVGDQAARDKDPQYKAMQVQYLDKINANGGNMDIATLNSKVAAMDAGASIKAASQVDLNADLRIKFNPKEIENAVKEAIEKGAKNPDDIKDALKDVFTKMGKDGEATLMKIVNAAFEKYLTTLDK